MSEDYWSKKWENMLISVNICLYNSKPYIKETLDSVFTQSYQDFEIIATDDGSTDGTYEFIQENYKDTRLKLYRQENHGLSYSRNRCAELSSGVYLAFLDHDDVWVPEKLGKQVDAIRVTEHKPSLVFSNSQIIDNDGNKGQIKRVSDYRVRLRNNFFETILRAKKNIICLSGVLMQKSLWDDGIARFDSSYKMAEEYDVWLKASYQNSAYAYIPEVLVYYRIHGENFTLKEPELMYLEPIDILDKWYSKTDHHYHKLIRENIASFYLSLSHLRLRSGTSSAFNSTLESARLNFMNIQLWWLLIKSVGYLLSGRIKLFKTKA